MLTADDDDQALVQGLPRGADDHTCVRLVYTDLVQRAKALLRRSCLQNKSQSTKQIKLGDNIEIDCANLSGQCAQGKLEFTPQRNSSS